MGGTQVFESQHTFSHIAGNTLKDTSFTQGDLRDGCAARRSRAARPSKSPHSTVRRHRPAQSTSRLELITKSPTTSPNTPSIIVHTAHHDATLADNRSIKPPTENTSIKVSPSGKQSDGNNKPRDSAARGTAPIASSSTTANMAGKLSQVLPPRPPMVSHTSNSVPSTPHQYAREFISRSRSPSPQTHLTGNHSPRSVKSEANGYMASLPRGRPTCKYETAAAFGRRRIQYDIGDALLEKAKEEPKQFLNPDEENKLSGDMRELYDRLLPSEESEQRRKKLVEKLERILRKEWPGNEFTVTIFGSSGNMLCTNESDGKFLDLRAARGTTNEIQSTYVCRRQ